MFSIQKVFLWIAVLNGIALMVFFNVAMSGRNLSEIQTSKNQSLYVKDVKEEAPKSTKVLKAQSNKRAEKLNEQIKKAEEKIYRAEHKFDKKPTSVNQKIKYFAPLFSPNGKYQKFARKTNPFFLMGAYPPVKVQMAHTGLHEVGTYNKVHYGLFNDADYCEKVDFYNLANPDNIFKKQHIFTDYPKGGLPRRLVIPAVGQDMMPEIDKKFGMSSKLAEYKHHFDTRINNFFIGSDAFHKFHKMGTHFLCATQMFNRIPGARALIRKDDLVESVDKYAESYKDKPQCFNKNMFFPYSYRLYRKDECEAFLNLINSDQYKQSLKTEPIQYLIKVGHGSHSADGVFILDKAQTKDINEKYDYGRLCGEYKKPLLAQSYVANPLLLDLNNKFDFRVYMLIASTDPLIVYFHDGFLRASLSTYEKFSDERGKHLTNTHLAEGVFKQAREKKVHGMSEQELRDYHIWSFEELEDYLLESGKVKDPNWLDNHLRPQFKQAMVHTVKMASEFFWKQPNVYALYGLDFMLDENFNLWFIEGNPNPQLAATNPFLGSLLEGMLKSLFDIQYGLYRSRMKRIYDVIKRFQEEKGRDDFNLDFWKDEYKNAASNRFEHEYKPLKNNTWMLVMDESLPVEKAYNGNLAIECAKR